MIIDLPQEQGIARRTRMYIGDEVYGVKLYDEFFHVSRWSEAYENEKSIGYVYAPSQLATAVHLAFRDIVMERARIRFSDESWRYAKVSPYDLARFSVDVRKARSNTPLFNVPPNIIQRKKYLRTSAKGSELIGPFQGIIENLAERFHKYESQTGDLVSQHLISEWLLQFAPEDISLAIQLLQHVRFWDRQAIVSALSSSINLLPSRTRRSQWLALGGPTTSSHHIQYFLLDVQKNLDTHSMEVLESAENVEANVPLVLYEDNIGSGKQPLTVLQQWFGVPDRQWLVPERHVSALSSRARRSFRSCEVIFLFLTGWRSGLDLLLRQAPKLLRHKRATGHVIAPTDLSVFDPAALIFESRQRADAARIAFEAAGIKAIDDKRRRWGPTKSADRILGYGNRGGVTVFYYNVPTTTVTALWKGCKDTWAPLFPRREASGMRR